jgi:hypothetical protein
MKRHLKDLLKKQLKLRNDLQYSNTRPEMKVSGFFMRSGRYSGLTDIVMTTSIAYEIKIQTAFQAAVAFRPRRFASS